MSVDVLVVADAVVAALNAASVAREYSQTFTAVRRYLPYMDVSSGELVALKVSVCCTAIEQARQDRASIAKRPTILVAVQKKVAAVTDVVMDPLLQLVREINDDLIEKCLTITDSAVLMVVNNNPLYVPEHLHEALVFSSFLNCMFRIR